MLSRHTVWGEGHPTPAANPTGHPTDGGSRAAAAGRSSRLGLALGPSALVLSGQAAAVRGGSNGMRPPGYRSNGIASCCRRRSLRAAAPWAMNGSLQHAGRPRLTSVVRSCVRPSSEGQRERTRCGGTDGKGRSSPHAGSHGCCCPAGTATAHRVIASTPAMACR